MQVMLIVMHKKLGVRRNEIAYKQAIEDLGGIMCYYMHIAQQAI